VAFWTGNARLFRSPGLRYSYAVGCVGIALGIALVLQFYGSRGVESPIFQLAIVLIAWNVGSGPTWLAVFLCSAAFDYFFTQPYHSFAITTEEIPYYLIFTASAAIIANFATVRRRIEDDLRQTTERLLREVEHRRHREEEVEILNKQLSERAEQLQETNKELESFAYSVSHDLRAPLRHVAGYSELLLKHSSSVLDEKGMGYTQAVLESAQRMGTLIDDLLAFSRIGRAEANKRLVSLDTLTKDVVTDIALEVPGRQIEWKIGPLPACFGDPSMLKVVLTNLVSNAVKFTRLRQSAVIEIGSTTKSDNEFVVYVRDNGAGFDMRYTNKLFGVFQRLHHTDEFEGTGIGLATVQRIIHRHGGKVWAEGKIQEGATFYFSLPIATTATERTVTTS
jgi:signal transduction histidine kinase